ncbi:hypothetical protein [Streptomyces lanatus]|uniref:Uncharacterized protein n=1 Tax=Streptomyces lanatus TaxID=66900 RepID=A0ABV1Y604_9ACTN|nr:hypothetical protein [Streptomyces lanatus]
MTVGPVRPQNNTTRGLEYLPVRFVPGRAAFTDRHHVLVMAGISAAHLAALVDFLFDRSQTYSGNGGEILKVYFDVAHKAIAPDDLSSA